MQWYSKQWLQIIGLKATFTYTEREKGKYKKKKNQMTCW